MSFLPRRLQDGDPGEHILRALAHFPLPGLAEQVLARHHRPQGRKGKPYAPVPRLALRRGHGGDELSVVSNFVEVWLAKEGHDGPIGINFLEKIQMATPAAAYGALLAGVDDPGGNGAAPRWLGRTVSWWRARRRAGTTHPRAAG